MSFPRYPKYKASGVEWLGELPEHWEVKLVRQLATVLNGFPFDSKLFDAAEGIPLIRIRDLNQVETDAFYKGEFIERAAVTSDDVLIGMDGDFNVGRWLGNGRALLNQRMCCVRGKSRLLTRLLEYSLPFPLKAINQVTYATTVKHLASNQIEKTFVALPPTLEEQRAIAEFLDRETAKLDGLVAEQRRLIELLKEKRQAVISHAVTKGLHPNAPTKPSGIPWLGDVPAHWEVKPIKRLCSVISKGTTPTTVGEEFRSEGVRFLKAENITEAGVSPEPEFFISEEAHALLSRGALQSLDVLVVIAGATTGKSAVLGEKPLPANTNQAVSYLRLHDTQISKFVNVWLGTSYIQKLISLKSVQAAQPNLSMEDLGNLPAPVPPLLEIEQISTFLDRELARFDALTAEAERAIDLLQERRTALISAAVTGQIDVRRQPRD